METGNIVKEILKEALEENSRDIVEVASQTEDKEVEIEEEDKDYFEKSDVIKIW